MNQPSDVSPSTDTLPSAAPAASADAAPARNDEPRPSADRGRRGGNNDRRRGAGGQRGPRGPNNPDRQGSGVMQAALQGLDIRTVSASAADPRPARGQRQNAPAAKEPRWRHPLLEQLAQWHPTLFGAQLQALKRGIFHDLMAAHSFLDKDQLKQALALHTRSTRYLNVVAQGGQRHDLQGQPVETLAPEHVYHALHEAFRRRKPRDGEDLQAKLVRRIAIAYQASGLARADYDALVRGRDEAANALLDQAFASVAERDAKAEALARAFAASGVSLEQFAEMYAMPLRAVQQALARAEQLSAAAQAVPETNEVKEVKEASQAEETTGTTEATEAKDA